MKLPISLVAIASLTGFLSLSESVRAHVHFTDAAGAVYLNAPDVLMPAGGSVFARAFIDPIAAPNTYAWETGIWNATGVPLIANLGFYFPRGPVFGTLLLN